MTKAKSSINRRDFLKRTSHSALALSAIQAAAAMGILSQSLGCGGSSSANSAAPTGPQAGPSDTDSSARPVDWPANVGAGKSVIVLGAGIAGMTSAYEMEKLGYAVTILEAQGRAGGRCQTIRAGDSVEEIDSSQLCLFDQDDQLYFNPGPARIPHHHDLILGYCRLFGVALEPFINDNQAALFHASNAFGGQPQIARQIIAETRGYIADLLADVMQQGNLSINLSSAEQSSLLALLQQYGELDSSFNYVAASRSGFVGQENADSRLRGQPPAQHQLSELLASNFWQFQLDFAQALDQQTTMLQPVGGMDQIARAFEQAVSDSIIYEAEVSEIRKASEGVRIVYLNAIGEAVEVTADYCICCIPATVLKQIDHDFSASHASAIENFTYTQSVKVAYQSPRFWENQQSIYGGISWTDQTITQIWYPSHGFGNEQGIIVGAYTFGQNAGQSLSNLAPVTRVDTVASQASQLHGQFSQSAGRGISVAWPKMPYQLGAWGSSSPGVLTDGDENIYFAGEHLSMLQGWQEGAILSAYHAVDQIVNRDAGG